MKRKSVKKCGSEVMEELCFCRYVVWHKYKYNNSQLIIDAMFDDMEDAICYARKLSRRDKIEYNVEETNFD